MIESKFVTLTSLNPRLYVIIGIITTVTAQILLKKSGTHSVFHLKWFIFIALSMASYSISFMSYYFALRYFEISTVQPIMMISIVGLVSIYGFAAGENFTFLKILGIILSTLSIILLSKS